MSTGRPEISVENQKQVYDYFETDPRNRLFLKVAIGISGLVFHPRIGFDEGAEELIASQSPVVLASNHIRMTDPLVIGAALQNHPSLRDLRNVSVAAKAPIFEFPIFDLVGAIPVFRPGMEVPKEQQILALRAGHGLIRTARGRLFTGSSFLIFPSGTYDPSTYRVQHKMLSGVARIAYGSSREDPARYPIVPIGIAYDPQRRPSLHFGYPIVFEEDRNSSQTTSIVQAEIQRCLVEAHRLGMPSDN